MTVHVAADPALHVHATILPGDTQADVFIVDGRFTFDPPERTVTVATGGWAIPGLVDAHAHLALHSPAPESAPEPDRIAASARAQLDAGVLAVREPGSPGRGSKTVAGSAFPTVITAGRFLAGVGRYFPGLAREVSPDELPDAVEEEVRWSGQWAKVIGDFFGPDGTLSTVFPTETLIEAAKRAHGAGGRIALHCMTPGAVEQALEARFDSVEHGTDVTDALVREMADSDVTWVPTMIIADPVRTMLPARPAADTDRLMAGLDRHPSMVGLASRLGVRVLAGTDAGMVRHGLVREEIRLLAAAGLSSFDALAAGSWEARSYLGLSGIEEQAIADVVVYSEDPTVDLSILAAPSLIVRAGRVVHPVD